MGNYYSPVIYQRHCVLNKNTHSKTQLIIENHVACFCVAVLRITNYYNMRHLYRSLLYRQAQEWDVQQFSRSAIVFSPHQDDETLGCGGTIARKKAAGADIKIVFMTDGSQSHAHLIPGDKLKSIRAHEALAAAQKLGIDENDVIFLEIPDGTLTKNSAIAMQKVTEIILNFLPSEIFIPYYQDGVADHNATNQVVITALKQTQFEAAVYEYPIWFWNSFPWTTCEENKRKIISKCLKFLSEFKSSVYIGDVLNTKIAALEQHKSQMIQLIPDSRWLTLKDVSQGEFLACFFQQYELFRHYKIRSI